MNSTNFKMGDIVEISGAYFKNDNGYWLVTNDNGSLTLAKLGKTGKLLESGSTTAFWPLQSYCSDRRKNAEARAHNAKNAIIQSATGINTFYAAEHFRKKADELRERAEDQRRRWGETGDVITMTARADRCAEIADRLSETYDKTDFVIRWADPETGEENSYEGRYDLGDGDGGMIEHIRHWADNMPGNHDEWVIQAEQKERADLADYLEQYTEGGRIVKVEIAPGVIDLLAYRKRKEQEKREQARREMDDLRASAAMLTDEQLEAAVLLVDPQNKSEIDVARFFLQELSRRDEKKALDLFRRWQSGQGA